MNNTQKKILAIVSGIALITIAITAILLVYLLPNLSDSYMLNENNTIEYNATVKNVEKTNGGYLIIVAEYDVKLKVDNEILTSGCELDSVLCEGDDISFRIAGPRINLLEVHDVELVIASLNHERDEIISLGRSNERYINSIKNMRISITVVSIVLMFTAVVIFAHISMKSKKLDNANFSHNSHS